MKFIEAPDDVKNCLFARRVSEDGKIEMFVIAVAFGYRVGAGYVGACGPELNWCCGDRQTDVELVYTIMKTILEGQLTEEGVKGDCFKGLRSASNIKPLFNDADFLGWICEAYSVANRKIRAGDEELIKLPPVEEMRKKTFEAAGL